jgi:hypothetical protein
LLDQRNENSSALGLAITVVDVANSWEGYGA